VELARSPGSGSLSTGAKLFDLLLPLFQITLAEKLTPIPSHRHCSRPKICELKDSDIWFLSMHSDESSCAKRIEVPVNRINIDRATVRIITVSCSATWHSRMTGSGQELVRVRQFSR